MEISNHGQILSLVLPDGWQEVPFTQSPGQLQSWREFRPPNATAAKLCLFYRGHQTSSRAADNFQRLLDQPAHQLSLEEVNSVEETIGNTADNDAFQLLSASTENWNGRMVLLVQGEWTQTQLNFYGIFLDADGTGSVVQEIYFEAPGLEFAEYILPVRTALDGIQWKPLSRTVVRTD